VAEHPDGRMELINWPRAVSAGTEAREARVLAFEADGQRQAA
jgi:hypothetical protein